MVNALFDKGRREAIRKDIRHGNRYAFKKQAPSEESAQPVPMDPAPIPPAPVISIGPPPWGINPAPAPAAVPTNPPNAVPSSGRSWHSQAQLDNQLITGLHLKIDSEVCDALSHGANPDARDANGIPALILAVEYGYGDLMNDFRKANADAQDATGRTALMAAIVSGVPDLFNAVLSLNPNIEIKNNSGQTALMLVAGGACRHRSPQYFTRRLLELGANAGATDKEGNTPLIKAAAWSPWSVLRMLGEKSDVNHQNDRGFTALMVAVGQSDDTAVSTLLDLKADPNLLSKEGYDALSYAIEGNSITIAQTLLSRGAKVDVTYKDGYTALRKARVLKKKDFVKLLKKHRAAE